MQENTSIQTLEQPEKTTQPTETHLRIAGENRDSQDDQSTTTATETAQKEFNASETYSRLKQMIRGFVDQYANELSQMSKTDYQFLTQQMVNHPKLGTITNLILENFKGWSAENNPTITRQDILPIAQSIAGQIDQIPDEDFFGDMADIEGKRNDLYRLYMKDANKKADMTILGSQFSQRASRLMKSAA